MSSIMVKEYTDPDTTEKSFNAYFSVDSGEAQVGDEDEGEKIIAIIDLDRDDPGIAALASVLDLAVNAASGSFSAQVPVPAEDVLTQIFMAGRASV